MRNGCAWRLTRPIDQDFLLPIRIEIGSRDAKAVRPALTVQLIKQGFRLDQILQHRAAQMRRVQSAE